MRRLVVAILALSLGPGVTSAAESTQEAVSDDLKASLPPSLTCQDYPRSEVTNDPFEYGAAVAIICDNTEKNGYQNADYIALFRFPNGEALDDYWTYRTGLNPQMSWRGQACANGKQAYGTWAHGEYFCTRSTASRGALIRWTNTTTNTYGVLDATDRNIKTLFHAWVALRETPTAGFSFAGWLSTLNGPTSATLLRDGRVLVIGAGSSTTAEVWDPDTETFGRAGSLPTARWNVSTTLLNDGRVLLVGGVAEGERHIAAAKVWDAATGSFTQAGRLTQPRDRHDALLLPDGSVLIVGGCCAEDGLGIALAELWDLETGRFRPAGELAERREHSTVTALPDGRVLVVGGWTETEESARAEVWDPATEDFRAAGEMAEPRAWHEATLLANGRVLVTGGGSRVAEVWDPGTESFSPAGSLAIGRDEFATTLLPDGRVLVISTGTGSAEVWDAEAESFSPAGSLAIGRDEFTTTLLPDGRVLVAGGWADSPLSTAEVWDPADMVFEPAGAMAFVADGALDVLLPDGRVFVVGGSDEGGFGAEIWDPDGPTWSAAPPPFRLDRVSAEDTLLGGVRRGIADTCKPVRGRLPKGSWGGVDCQPLGRGIERVRVYLFRSEEDLLDDYFAKLRSRGVDPRVTQSCRGSGPPCEAPYHPTLPKDRLTYPYRAGCFLDRSRRAHFVMTMPPLVTAEVTGRGSNCEAVLNWSWRGNQDIPGGPTVWR